MLSIAVVASGDLDQQLVGWGAARSGYHRTITDGDGEFDLDSEVSRRILAASKYISYGALSQNIVPCSRRGASY
ncbi:hypothetical protein RHMOL_Rhmol05G0196600 [Rhododendron molle]|uniref:Uncharacterized protein n=1 Tax=Rhododendron molle TaxID=49168 RepID=A0ACC0NT55_RHOML|nr:hypothetical protein RHMOL_Rhmol05G0196600 [Rhododendron molle]